MVERSAAENSHCKAMGTAGKGARILRELESEAEHPNVANGTRQKTTTTTEIQVDNKIFIVIIFCRFNSQFHVEGLHFHRILFHISL
jgi:hypothetical protein